MHQVIEIQILGDVDNPDYRVWLKFEDGEEKVVDFYPFIGKGFTKNLLEFDEFKKIFIEPGGGVAWPNGFDFCPNYLKELKSLNSLNVK